MTPISYSDPKKFWQEASPELKKEEAKNSLCLGLSYHFQSDPKDCVYQLTARGPSGLLAALVCSRYRTNLNFVASPVENADHAKKLFEEFRKQDLAVTGIIGETKTANIYKGLFEGAGKKTKIHMRQGIFRCSRVIAPRETDRLNFRIANANDIETVGQWIEDFHSEAVPHDPPVNGRELAETRIGKEQVYVLERNRRLVSLACWSRDIETSCSVNLVYTPVTVRKNGYGSLVTAKLTQHLVNSGKGETNLYTNMANPTSNKIYQNIGYEFVCESAHLGVSS